LTHRAHGVLVALAGAPALPVRVARGLWRRSLLVRVVVATLLLSGVVVTGLGLVLVDQVGRGLVKSQERQALQEHDAGLLAARESLRTASTPQEASVDRLQTVYASLQGRSGGQFEVLLLPGRPDLSSFGLDPSTVPTRLRRAVARGDQADAYVRVGADRRPLLLVGARLGVTGVEGYELYYSYRLDQQEETLALVRARLLAGGVAVVLLLAGVAALVARQVVTPVRLAARVARRLADGRLTERLVVKGSDDLATLARSFNAMAAGLQRQIGQLEELSRVQRRFTADVSHELRTPLTTVRMAADVLHASRAAFPGEVARAAELLQGELDRFESLLADLLEISRYDANAAVLEVEPVDVAALVRDAAALVRPIAVERGVALDLHGVPAGPVLAEVDPRRVSRVLRNLLANAVEHAEGRPVVLTLAADAGAVGIRVRDRGVGLRPEDAERVFDRFWRADPSRARQSGGTGLGLSIALEDARLHGGWLQAWGSPGQGAAFRLVLPRHAGGALRSAPLPLADPPGPQAPDVVLAGLAR